MWPARARRMSTAARGCASSRSRRSTWPRCAFSPCSSVSFRQLNDRLVNSRDDDDVVQDPYILRNHLGGLECRLCLTLHTNEGSYLAHTQGKKHQTNLARRAARESRDNPAAQQQMLAAMQASQKNVVPVKHFIKIGSPGYQVPLFCLRLSALSHGADGRYRASQATKVRDPITGQLGLLFQVHYPQIAQGIKPRHRFMSSYEQHKEPPNRAWQYLLVASLSPSLLSPRRRHIS